MKINNRKKEHRLVMVEAPAGSLIIPPDKINIIFEYIFIAGMKCRALHPDDDSYDAIHLKGAKNRVIKSLGKIKSKYKKGGLKDK